jgi:hypothetical protein
MLASISLWLGTNIIVDLRLLGVGKKRQTAAQLSDALFAWNWIGFSVVVLGGFLLFSGIGTDLSGQSGISSQAGPTGSPSLVNS